MFKKKTATKAQNKPDSVVVENALNVYDGENLIRRYSLADFGPAFKDKALRFAAENGYVVRA